MGKRTHKKSTEVTASMVPLRAMALGKFVAGLSPSKTPLTEAPNRKRPPKAIVMPEFVPEGGLFE